MKLGEPKRMCPKAVPTHLQNHHVVWSRTLECSVKSYVTGPSTKFYFNDFLFMWVFIYDIIGQNNSCEQLACHGLPVCVRPASKRWFLKIVQVTMKHESIWCHVGIHVDFTSILHSLIYSIGPSSVVWSELGPASTFSTNESAWSVTMTISKAHVWSGPKIGHHEYMFSNEIGLCD
jgi:hypothetical protein